MTDDQKSPRLPVVVDPKWLEDHIDAVVVADVRWYLDGRSGHDAYLGGHLPGAVWVDVDTDLAAPATPEGGRHPLPVAEAFAAALGRLGIGDDTSVVAYDDAGGSVAARLVWMLRTIGSSAGVLDGGIQAWQGELETGAVVPDPARRTPVPWPADRVVDTATMRAEVRDGTRLVLDARAPGRFTGESPAPVDHRPGHIPGARNAAWQHNLAEDGRFAAPSLLRERYAELGAGTAESVTAYCGSGVTACHDLLAMEHAGFTGARLYPGSMSAWMNDPGRAVETGAA